MRKNLFRIALAMMTCIATVLNVNAQDKKIDYQRLITAIGTVESKMDCKAKNGDYVGFLQISTICLKDCNRINREKGNPTRYMSEDRYNMQKSIEMFKIIQNYYNKQNDIHYAILLWNEGCAVMKKAKRQTPYYRKVMDVYNNLSYEDD